MALHWSSLVECMERVPCWPCTNSKYVCSNCCLVCDWPYWKLLLVFDVACMGRMWFYLIRHFAFRIHRNVNNGPCIDFPWLNVFLICIDCVPCWPWTKREYVCSYYYVMCDWPYSKLLLVMGAVCMDETLCNLTSYAILLSECILTSIMALHWSSLVEYMERVPYWPWTNSAYVCSYFYVVCDWPYSKLLLVFDTVCMGHI